MKKKKLKKYIPGGLFGNDAGAAFGLRPTTLQGIDPNNHWLNPWQNANPNSQEVMNDVYAGADRAKAEAGVINVSEAPTDPMKDLPEVSQSSKNVFGSGPNFGYIFGSQMLQSLVNGIAGRGRNSRQAAAQRFNEQQFNPLNYLARNPNTSKQDLFGMRAGGTLSPEKAAEMLRDGTANGKPLTDKQKKYFGRIASGKMGPGGMTGFNDPDWDFLYGDEEAQQGLPVEQKSRRQLRAEADAAQDARDAEEDLANQNMFNSIMMPRVSRLDDDGTPIYATPDTDEDADADAAPGKYDFLFPSTSNLGYGKTIPKVQVPAGLGKGLDVSGDPVQMKKLYTYAQQQYSRGNKLYGINEMAWNPMGVYDQGVYQPGKTWKNHDNHIHFGFEDPVVATNIINYGKQLGLHLGENPAVGKVHPVHTKGSFHYSSFKGGGAKGLDFPPVGIPGHYSSVDNTGSYAINPQQVINMPATKAEVKKKEEFDKAVADHKKKLLKEGKYKEYAEIQGLAAAEAISPYASSIPGLRSIYKDLAYKYANSDNATDYNGRDLLGQYIYGNQNLKPIDLPVTGLDRYYKRYGDIPKYELQSEIPNGDTVNIPPRMYEDFMKGAREIEPGVFAKETNRPNPVHPYEDIAGHMMYMDTRQKTPMLTTRDIWKFTPDDYMSKWTVGQSPEDIYMMDKKVRMLERAGKPFILMQQNPVEITDRPQWMKKGEHYFTGEEFAYGGKYKYADGGSFAEAFREARAEKGPGKTFTWNGKLYSTNLAEESSPSLSFKPGANISPSKRPLTREELKATAARPSTGRIDTPHFTNEQVAKGRELMNASAAQRKKEELKATAARPKTMEEAITANQPSFQSSIRIPESGVVVDKRTGKAYVMKTGKVDREFPVLTGENVEGNVNMFDMNSSEPSFKDKATPVGYYMSSYSPNMYGAPGLSLNPIPAYGLPAPLAKDIGMHATYDPATRDPLYGTDTPWASFGCVNCKNPDIVRLANEMRVHPDTIMVADSKNPEHAALLAGMKSKKKGEKKKGGMYQYDGGGKALDPTYAALADVMTNRNRNLNWVQRGLLPEAYPSIYNFNTGEPMTHMLSTGEDDMGHYVYPNIIQNEDGTLQDLDPDEAHGWALESGTTMGMPSRRLADFYSRQGLVRHPDQPQFSDEYRTGGIHINPKNRGKFNATKKRTGKTTEELTHSKDPLTRKRAIFAQNAAKWHHQYGGEIGGVGDEVELTPIERAYYESLGYTFE